MKRHGSAEAIQIPTCTGSGQRGNTTPMPGMGGGGWRVLQMEGEEELLTTLCTVLLAAAVLPNAWAQHHQQRGALCLVTDSSEHSLWHFFIKSQIRSSLNVLSFVQICAPVCTHELFCLLSQPPARACVHPRQHSASATLLPRTHRCAEAPSCCLHRCMPCQSLTAQKADVHLLTWGKNLDLV